MFENRLEIQKFKIILKMAYSSTILECLQNLAKSTEQLCFADDSNSEIRPFKRRLARNSEIARLHSYCDNPYILL